MSGGRTTRRTNSGASSMRGSPGTTARSMPAMTSRIDGAMLARRAMIATATSTVSISSMIWMVPVMSSYRSWIAEEKFGRASNRARRNVDGDRQQRGIEEERDDAVRGGGAADDLRRDGYVGNLRGHADDEGEIDEVPIVRFLLAGKGEATALTMHGMKL